LNLIGENLLINWKQRLEKKLQEFLEGIQPPILQSAMAYYPLQGGKRLRPLIVCAVAVALGGDLEDAITVGCSVEFIHNYSLIHDDLPPLDNDQYRRGKPTCHVVFGEDLALLAGDALLTLAFEVLSDKDNFRTLEADRLLLMIKLLSKKAGAKGMVGGQVMDVRKLGELEHISLKKTAELFSACFMLGGLVAKRDDLVSDLERVGMNFGLLFQMCDDYKDKDGFYQKFGEGLKDLIEAKGQEVASQLEALGLLTAQMQAILDSFL
jgi:farnesyl-diphosphate synthase (EC 2.5.1.10)